MLEVCTLIRSDCLPEITKQDSTQTLLTGLLLTSSLIVKQDELMVPFPLSSSKRMIMKPNNASVEVFQVHNLACAEVYISLRV